MIAWIWQRSSGLIGANGASGVGVLLIVPTFVANITWATYWNVARLFPQRDCIPAPSLISLGTVIYRSALRNLSPVFDRLSASMTPSKINDLQRFRTSTDDTATRVRTNLLKCDQGLFNERKESVYG